MMIVRDRLNRISMRTCSAIVVASLLLSACRPAPVVTGTGEPGAGAVVAGAAAGPAIPARVPATFPAGWPHPAGQRATFAPNAMISSNTPEASEAGVEILRRGGNAIDAAVAVGYALLVTHPEAGNIGGGGYMVIRMADGREAALDYREVAPLAATRDMYLDAQGNVTDAGTLGHLASGVPGAVAGMSEALARYGSMTLAQVMEPAIRLAADGFTVDSALYRSLMGSRAKIERFAGGSFWFPGGSAPAVGTVLRQPELARTLRLIAASGPAAFYEGEIAGMLVAEMQRGGGIITREDLRRYRPAWRTPVKTSYRGHALLAMPPSSSGGVTMAQTLNIMETWNDVAPFGSAQWAHRLGSAYQLAFIDRNAKLADPDFVPVPMQELMSKDYARSLRAMIEPARATPTPAQARRMNEGQETTHYSVVDRHGNAVATTTTINELYGSGVYIPGAGFFMNNEMDDFSAKPGTPNVFGLVQGEQNAIQPGKRMLSAMSPTIVMDPRGDVLLVVGSRGGPRIITSTSQVILNVIDHRMTLADAMSAPRIHHQSLPDSLRHERDALEPAVMEALRRMGHGLMTGPGIGQVKGVMRVPGGWEGFVDPRTHGGVAGH
jgi:gamma-glutamyltranspeptidase / glutathione hydrolase